MNKEYLGDGLYVEIQNGMIRLWTERIDGTHEVFLEPEVMDNFLNWFKKLNGVSQL